MRPLPDINSEYRALEELNSRSLLSLYKARRLSSNSLVFLSLLHDRGMRGCDDFLSLTQRAAHSRHPAFPAVLSSGRADDGAFFLVYQYQEGQMLSDALKTREAFSPEEALRVISWLTDALSALREPLSSLLLSQLFLHQDPTGKSQLLLFDAGQRELWRANQNQTRAGALMSITELALMSPESISGRYHEATGDIYSLGALWYHLLTKRLPYHSDVVFQMLVQIMNEPFPDIHRLRPELPASHRAVLQRMTAKPTPERYQSIESLKDALALLGEAQSSSSYFFGKREVAYASLSDPAKARLQEMQTEETPLRVERSSVLSRLLWRSREQFWYLHPSYLIGRDKESITLFSWAYLSLIGLRDNQVSLSFLSDFRQLSTLQRTNTLAPRSPFVVQFEYQGSTHELSAALSVFVEKTRASNAQKLAHTAPEATLFPFMLNWRPT